MVIPTFLFWVSFCLDLHHQREPENSYFQGFTLNSMGVTSALSESEGFVICQIKILDLLKVTFESVTCISRNFYYLEVQDT